MSRLAQGNARNNYGEWKIEKVEVDKNIKGFDFYTQRDFEMVNNTDIMIWKI